MQPGTLIIHETHGTMRVTYIGLYAVYARSTWYPVAPEIRITAGEYSILSKQQAGETPGAPA